MSEKISRGAIPPYFRWLEAIFTRVRKHSKPSASWSIVLSSEDTLRENGEDLEMVRGEQCADARKKWNWNGFHTKLFNKKVYLLFIDIFYG